MIFSVQVKVMPLPNLLDPQGKAVLGSLKNLQLNTVSDVRIGKHIDLRIDVSSKEEAIQIATEAAQKLLANPVMEHFEVTISPCM